MDAEGWKTIEKRKGNAANPKLNNTKNGKDSVSGVVIMKTTKLDKYKETKGKKQKPKMTTIRRNSNKSNQEKEVEFPETEDQWQRMNIALVKVNTEKIKKGRKFSSKVAILGDLIIGNEHITKVGNKAEHPPHFGLDPKVAEKYTGWRDKERGREYQLIDEPDPPNVQDQVEVFALLLLITMTM
ncbi:hypothetical protein RND71_024602 [Anisodus tanguticus]|uniref:Uncharacterized protein n=1 Tax=Anisodus tanguticus TaxID=243964 RepID=A0AAE1V9M9_9SOLA|nr:hypothetical protein RND71_024602 [Anisodus tanguticus]